MSDRLEYPGNPLPSGLPGFGGGTVDVVVLPGFNRVVAAQKFGPVNDAPNITVPDSVPPAGSNPEDPTNEVVSPAPAPPSNAAGGLSKKLDKVPPCDQVNGLFGAFKDCGKDFEEYTVCENGEPTTKLLFTFQFSPV
jgi:hypothetical protein